MPVSCESCGAANRANANFCIGCAAKLPGFSPTGPSALEILKGLEPRKASLRRPARAAVATERLATSAAEVLRPLAAVGLLVMLGFIGWYLYVKRSPEPPVARPASDAVVVREPAAAPSASLEPDLSALAAVSPAAQAAAARTTDRLASASAAALPRPSPRPVEPEDGRGATDTVARFYRALGTGDGGLAAQWVTAGKRERGPLSGSAMSSFYRSLAEPLRIRSIRQLDAQLVEARYTYRATRSTCEGRALLTMESADPAARIRTISANC